MSHDLTVITAPVIEPISLQEAKDHLRVDSTDEDALIDALIITARETVENHLARALITRVWDWNLEHFEPEITVPKAPLQSVTSIKYYDSDNVEQTLDSSVYEVDAASDDHPGRIRPVVGQDWPSVYDRYGAITIRFQAGYGTGVGDIPYAIKAAMLLLVAHFWCNREMTTDRAQTMVPMGYFDLIAPYIVWKF